MMDASLRRYAAHCQQLLRSADDVLADAQLEKDAWRLHYAVDFSEVYAFLLPGTSAPPYDAVGEYVALSRFFSRKGIVLLHPYALELHAFGSRVLSAQLSTSLTLMADALAALQQALLTDDVDEVSHLARASDHRTLTDKEIEVVTRFFEERGGAIAALARGVNLDTMERLRRLLQSRTFVGLDALLAASDTVDQRAVQEHFYEFSKRRPLTPPAASYIDGMALEQIRHANRELAHTRQRVLLVTRSPHLREVGDAIAAQDGTSTFIRDPQIFSATFQPADGAQDTFLHTLRQRRDSLALFLATIQKRDAADDDRPRIDGMINQIENDWKGVESLTTTLSPTGELERRQLATALLTLIRDSAALVAAARKRIVDLIEAADRTQILMSFELQDDDAASRCSLPYHAELSSPRATQRIRELTDCWTVPISALFALLHDLAATPGSLGDFLLGSALVLGGLQKWELASRYAGLAVERLGAEGQPEHEARFFSAMFLREAADRVSDSPKADEVLRQARKNLEHDAGERMKSDPRYLLERAYLSVREKKTARQEAAELIHLIEDALSAEMPRPLRLRLLIALMKLQHSLSFSAADTARWRVAMEDIAEGLFNSHDEWPQEVRELIQP